MTEVRFIILVLLLVGIGVFFTSQERHFSGSVVTENDLYTHSFTNHKFPESLTTPEALDYSKEMFVPPPSTETIGNKEPEGPNWQQPPQEVLQQQFEDWVKEYAQQNKILCEIPEPFTDGELQRTCEELMNNLGEKR